MKTDDPKLPEGVVHISVAIAELIATLPKSENASENENAPPTIEAESAEQALMQTKLP